MCVSNKNGGRVNKHTLSRNDVRIVRVLVDHVVEELLQVRVFLSQLLCKPPDEGVREGSSL